MKTYAIKMLVVLLTITPGISWSQATKKQTPKDSVHVGVDEYISDYYKVSRPNTKGNLNGTYISNNGDDNNGSIALSTSPGPAKTPRICLDVRPTGETQILTGPRRGDPTLLFNGSNVSTGAWGRLTSTGHLAFGANSHLINDESPDMFIHGNGSVGIGMIPPETYAARLLINGNMIVQANASVKVSIGSDGATGFLGTTGGFGLKIGANLNMGQSSLFIAPNNKYVVVNADKAIPPVNDATANKYGLFVLKGILSESFAVSPGSSWADYVFDQNYPLRPLDSVEAYVAQYRHLPNLPSASEIEKQGYDLHDINKRFLEKIEELTLYNIQSGKLIRQQQQEIEFLKNQLKALSDVSLQLEELKKQVDQLLKIK